MIWRVVYQLVGVRSRYQIHFASRYVSRFPEMCRSYVTVLAKVVKVKVILIKRVVLPSLSPFSVTYSYQ